MLDPLLRAQLATEGLDVDAPVARHGGAGPTGDGHVVVDGSPLALPLRKNSRFRVAGGSVWMDGRDLHLSVEPVGRPLFYDRTTSDGIPMHMLARLHGADVLATTVVQTCVRYGPDQRCRYCSIEQSLDAGTTTRVKTPAQLAEVAHAAVSLDRVRQMVMTTGTSAAPDRGARYLARCARGVRSSCPDLPLQVQCEPPSELSVLSELRTSGVNSIGIHAESLDESVRSRWLPGKARVPLDDYWDAWAEAVDVFGWNQVSTYLLVGLGEHPDELVEGAARLIGIGVYPFVVPVRPGAGTLAAADGLSPPDPEYVAEVSGRVAALLRQAGMEGTRQSSGCASCGACSTVPRSHADPVVLAPIALASRTAVSATCSEAAHAGIGGPG